MSVGTLYPMGGGSLVAEVVAYDSSARSWLARSGHYLDNPPPGCLMCVALKTKGVGLCGVDVAIGPICGMCLLGRPSARMLPQDGSVAEVKRFVLADGLPYGTASALLRASAEAARAHGIRSLISYHDRTRHTGCIYKKAGFKRDGVTTPPSANAKGWATRAGSATAPKSQHTSKRRWRLDLWPAAPLAAQVAA